MDRLDAMATYVQIVDAGGFAAAARRLGRSRATISRQVQQLEEFLQVRLLNRTTRTLRLTDAGSAYYAFAQDYLERIREFEERITDDQKAPSGELRVVATKSFGSEVLADAITEFAANHPGIRPTLVLEDFSFRSYDFMKQGHDLALWLSPQQESRVIGRKLATMEWVACASPAYLAAQGEPKVPEDLLRHGCLTHINMDASDGSWSFAGSDGDRVVHVSGVFASNSALVLRKAALRGLGIAILPRYSIDRDLDSGALVHVLPAYRTPSRNLMMYLPERRYVPHQVRLFIDFLATWFARSI